jgi:hypothetical protein
MASRKDKLGPLGRLLRRAPDVPDPGQNVRLMGPDGAWRGGFVAVSGPLSDDRYGVVVRVAEEKEFLASRRERRRPVALSWPLGMLDIEG